MPLYEYLCDACGRRFEVIQKFSDPPLEHCPECGGTVRKQVAAPAFQFKGTGWYITDYAKKQPVKTEAGRSESSSKEGSRDEAQTGKSTEKAPEKSSASAASPAGSSSGSSASKGPSEG
jgi:putative FmdB family regulatory protein